MTISSWGGAGARGAEGPLRGPRDAPHPACPHGASTQSLKCTLAVAHLDVMQAARVPAATTTAACKGGSLRAPERRAADLPRKGPQRHWNPECASFSLLAHEPSGESCRDVRRHRRRSPRDRPRERPRAGTGAGHRDQPAGRRPGPLHRRHEERGERRRPRSARRRARARAAAASTTTTARRSTATPPSCRRRRSRTSGATPTSRTSRPTRSSPRRRRRPARPGASIASTSATCRSTAPTRTRRRARA